MDINSCTFTGRVTKIRRGKSASGTSYLALTLLVNSYNTGTNFIDIVAFDELADEHFNDININTTIAVEASASNEIRKVPNGTETYLYQTFIANNIEITRQPKNLARGNGRWKRYSF